MFISAWQVALTSNSKSEECESCDLAGHPDTSKAAFSSARSEKSEGSLSNLSDLSLVLSILDRELNSEELTYNSD